MVLAKLSVAAAALAKLTDAAAKPTVADAAVMQSWCRCRNAKLVPLPLRVVKLVVLLRLAPS